MAVDPTNPGQMISGAFSSSFSYVFNCGTQNELDTAASPYWKSVNGGATWTDFGSLQTVDKSIAWQQNGAAALTTTLNFADAAGNTQIPTYRSGATTFGAAINTSAPGNLDQPWIRTGPAGKTYLTYNNLGSLGGRTASVSVSPNNGTTYSAPTTLETVAPAGGQDAPSVRSAVSGSTVYAAFTRWGSGINLPDCNSFGCNLVFPGSQVVVVRSSDAGGSFSSGVVAATTTGYFSNVDNTSITLGQERTGSDLAIAVDPNNPNRVVVAYGDTNGTGALQLHVLESTDGGATWASKFTTSSAVRSALPALTILDNGDVGLLYDGYDPIADELSQHFLTTTDDFASTSDTLLARESNKTPIAVFDPYIGDFFDLTSVGDTFYGIFSAFNADNGTLASFPQVTFQRDFTGIPGSASFLLTDLAGGPVDYSIDPFVFQQTLSAVPEPATLGLFGIGLAALARRRRQRSSARDTELLGSPVIGLSRHL